MAQPIKLATEGMLLNWLKDVGEQVSSGDVIAEIEADKATVEVEAPASGVLLEQKAAPGDQLAEGDVIGTIGDEGESGGDAAPEQEKPAARENGKQERAPEEEKAPTPASTREAESEPSRDGQSNGTRIASTTPEGRVKASPVARNMAQEKGIELSQVQGTGPGGRIVKADIENFQPTAAPAREAATPAPAQAGQATYGKLPEGDDVEIIDISRMRRRIADNTILSKQQIPHFYVTMEVDVEPLLALRKELNDSLAEEGVKISVNDMIIKATALTLKKFPNLNTHYYGDKMVRHKRINIGVSVALPDNGLMNVVVQDADKKVLSVMAEENKALYDRAREGKVKPDDLKGATFTISNLGPWNVDHFAAIIAPPEAGILAVGGAKKIPVVLEDGTLGVGTRMNVTIAVDHRVSDGAEGAEFLKEFKALIENPMRLLI